jgi:FHS family glucose/mannose:H+ symporter-like MFS transporter
MSLLGVFFGIGALGMPVVLGILQSRFTFESIVSIAGFATLAIGIWYGLLRFPAPKQTSHVPLLKNLSMVKDPVMILIAFFLFCQSSFEAIINNWTTSYLSSRFAAEAGKALYALSLFVAGMTLMRFLLGSVLRNTRVNRIWAGSFSMILLGLIFLWAGKSFYYSVAGLILLGTGLAGGFPIMLGFVGSRYKENSGTAFSFVLVVALLGNMGVNYGMGIIARNYGIHHLVTVAVTELFVMIILCTAILAKLKNNK